MKINAIKTPVVRKIMSTAMLAAATLGVTNVMAKPSKAQEAMPTQTEVMSPEAAKAAQAYAQQAGTYSYQNNPKLDAAVLAMSKDEAEAIKNKAGIEQTYRNVGTFATSMYLQNIIDMGYFQEKFLNDNITAVYLGLAAGSGNIPEDINVDAYDAKFKKFSEHIENVYKPWFSNLLASLLNTAPSAEKCSKTIDKVVNDNAWCDKAKYDAEVANFRSQQKDKYSVQGWSDLVAFKTYLIDKMFIEDTIKNFGLQDFMLKPLNVNSKMEYVKGKNITVLKEVFEDKAKPTP
ncbi:MAG: hypothetical protein E7Z92_03035 [Cyanobacteria bacterium SIG31]|nr:hypothetical protein [Cyanobacteria bacterium SIG31]